MFENVHSAILPICTKEVPASFHYKALMDHNMMPVGYIPVEKMNLNDPIYGNIRAQFPDLTGLVIGIQYTKPYS